MVESAGDVVVDARKFVVAMRVARSVAQSGVARAPQKGELVVVESAGDVAVDARKLVVAVCVARIVARSNVTRKGAVVGVNSAPFVIPAVPLTIATISISLTVAH